MSRSRRFRRTTCRRFTGCASVRIEVLGGPFIVRNGELVTTKGYATASTWLRRAVMPLKESPEADYVAQVLGGYDALPLGWTTAA